MKEKGLFKIIKKFSRKLPKFKDGRIDYSKSKSAAVLNVFVKYKDKVLLLKRSNKISIYQRKWNSIGGYLDELKPVKHKVLEELREELGIYQSLIKSIKYGKQYKLIDKSIPKTWYVQPVLVELKRMPKIKLDFEHTEFKWIYPKDIKEYDTIPKLDKVLKNIL